MAKNTPSAQTIATRTAGGPHFTAGIQQHVMLGDQVAGSGAHSGLHSLHLARAQYPGMTVANVTSQERMAELFAADVSLRGGKAAKRSSFFPTTMTWPQILAAITEAWRDSRIYAPQSEVYGQMAAKYGLSWCGYGTINGRRLWIGCTRAGTAANPIETAFPAINGKFE